jgi:exopolysaccharide biosynthesis operon protein EpsL
LREAESETITTGYVGLLIDKSYSQQRFFLGATATAYRYNNFSYLDFEGFDYRAAWYWKLGSRLGGTISADRTQTPTQFQDTFNRQSDVTTAKNYQFRLDAWLFSGWHLLAGVTQSYQTSEQASLQGQPDYDETSGEAGIRYLFRSGSTIDALRRRIDGQQESQSLNNIIVVASENYQEDQSELRATWFLSPASTLTARATYLDRRYDLTPASDFSGTTGELGYYWAPTIKLRMRLAAARKILPWQSLTSNYRVSNVFTFAPTWHVTDKTIFFVSYQHIDEDYPASSAAVLERKDTIDFGVIGVNWMLARHVSIGASVQYEQRSSNDPLVEYDTTIGRINASIIF